MKALFDGIMTKYTGSTFATACTGGLHWEFAPQKKAMPFTVFHLVSARPKDTFGDRIENFTVQFNIYSDTRTATSVDDMYAKLTALYDYCTLTVTGYTFVVMRRIFQNCLWDNDNEYWQYVVQYEIEIQKS